MRRFLSQWTLPIAMVAGIVGYFVYTALPFLNGTHKAMLHIVSVVQPVLIFLMLFITFCKVKPNEIRFARWHIYGLLMQVLAFSLTAAVVMWLQYRGLHHSMAAVAAECAMLCFICPTATAAAVVTSRLGGNPGTLTTYTILINFIAALLVPAVVPLLHPDESVAFGEAFLIIITKVFPLLIGPLLLAVMLRVVWPRLVRSIASVSGLAFYIWAVSLMLAIAVSVKALVHSSVTLPVVAGIAVASAAACALQFAIGRSLGKRYGDMISASQSCGQKNTVFAIWLGYTFLTPITVLAGGFYSIWHNIYNSWQLRRKARGGT